MENVYTHQNPKIDKDLFTVFGYNNEAEIWLKPCDAFRWDKEMIDKISQRRDHSHHCAPRKADDAVDNTGKNKPHGVTGVVLIFRPGLAHG